MLAPSRAASDAVFLPSAQRAHQAVDRRVRTLLGASTWCSDDYERPPSCLLATRCLAHADAPRDLSLVQPRGIGYALPQATVHDILRQRAFVRRAAPRGARARRLLAAPVRH